MRSRRRLLAICAVSAAGLGAISLSATTSWSAAADHPQNPATQRKEMIRVLGSIDRRLAGIETSLAKVTDRLAEDK